MAVRGYLGGSHSVLSSGNPDSNSRIHPINIRGCVIAAEIIEAHWKEIYATDSESGGTRFEITR